MGNTCNTCGGGRRFHCRKNGSKRDLSDDTGIDGCVILKWILNKMGGRGLDLSGSGQGQAASACNEGSCSGSLKLAESLAELKNCQFLRTQLRTVNLDVCYVGLKCRNALRCLLRKRISYRDFLGASKNCEKRLLASSCLSLRLEQCNNSTLSGWIFVKFGI